MRCPAVLTLILGAVLGGCGASSPPPLVTVSDAQVREKTADGAVVEFTLSADNPGPEPLPMRDVSYVVLLDGREVFRGTRSAEATLRRYGTQQVTLPAAIPAADQPAADRSRYSVRGTIVYLLPGKFEEILFESNVRRPKVAFSGEGEVSVGK